jgi:cobalt/nickel transport system permease protein
MHLADGFADPKVWATFDVVSGVTVAYAARKARAIVKPEQTASMGMAAAFIFAAQMVNFKVGPSSGHFVGAVLAGILFGPFVGTIVITAVVVLQALFFADGGIAALGINAFNMGLVGTFLGYYVYEGLTRILRFRAGEYVAAFAAAYLSLVTGAALLCLQLALFQPQVPLGPFFAAMMSVHLLIGLGEGAVTVGALLVVRRTTAEGARPQSQVVVAPRAGWVVAAVIGAIAIATVGAQFASRLPDGLEHSLAKQHVQPAHASPALPAWWPHRFDDYQTRGLAHPAVSLGAAGLVGVMLALLLVSVAGSLLAKRRGARLKPLPREDASEVT